MDCPICSSTKGLKDRQELVQHMEVHRNDPDLMIEKITDYISARERSRELQ
jgi:hypothetical protein